MWLGRCGTRVPARSVARLRIGGHQAGERQGGSFGWRKELFSAEVEFVSHSDTLMELGGVGCMLRYVTSEREVMSPNDCHRTASQGVDPNMAQVG